MLSYGISLVAMIILAIQSVKGRKAVLKEVLREQQREARLNQANKGKYPMNPRRKSRLSIIIFVILGISIATGLVLYALRQNIDLFYTPSEVVEGKDGNPDQKPEVGQRIRVGGMVVEGSVSRDPKVSKFALM